MGAAASTKEDHHIAATVDVLRAQQMAHRSTYAAKVGLFQAGSHRIVDIPRCGVHHPAINAAAAALRRAIRATDLPPYADRPHTGLVRSLQAVVERPGGRLQIVVTTRDASAGAALPLLESLRSDLGERLHSQRLFASAPPPWRSAASSSRRTRSACSPT